MTTADRATSVPTQASRAESRYTLTAQALHWLTALLILAILPIAWVMFNMPKDAPERGLLFTIHKALGLTIWALVVIRLLWRARYHAPTLANGLAHWQVVTAHASHWLLYLVLFFMPISGYVSSAAGGHPVTYFGLYTLPGLAKDEGLEHAATSAHLAGQWILYALILLHVAAATWHAAIRRDGVINRILPPQQRV
jgi:cytochrome b561